MRIWSFRPWPRKASRGKTAGTAERSWAFRCRATAAHRADNGGFYPSTAFGRLTGTTGGLLGPVWVADLGLSLCCRVQDWLQVEDRCSVEDFEVTYENSQARSGKDLNAVQADRVWPVR